MQDLIGRSAGGRWTEREGAGGGAGRRGGEPGSRAGVALAREGGEAEVKGRAESSGTRDGCGAWPR
jgi:hypothetical protein